MITDILNLHAEILRQRIVGQMAAHNKNASGKTAKGLQVIVTDSGFKLIDTTGNFHFVEHGSAPHKDKRVSHGFAEIIKQWIKTKGIPVKGNPDSVAYAIAAHLKRKGSKQHLSKKPAGIIQSALDKEYIDRLRNYIVASISDFNFHNSDRIK
jgi:hypothetical protein